MLRVLHNPRYAGAFCFGRTRWRKRPGDRLQIERLPREQWIALLPDAHPGYISWEQFEANLARLRANAQAYGADRRKSRHAKDRRCFRGSPSAAYAAAG